MLAERPSVLVPMQSSRGLARVRHVATGHVISSFWGLQCFHARGLLIETWAPHRGRATKALTIRPCFARSPLRFGDATRRPRQSTIDNHPSPWSAACRHRAHAHAHAYTPCPNGVPAAAQLTLFPSCNISALCTLRTTHDPGAPSSHVDLTPEHRRAA